MMRPKAKEKLRKGEKATRTNKHKAHNKQKSAAVDALVEMFVSASDNDDDDGLSQQGRKEDSTTSSSVPLSEVAPNMMPREDMEDREDRERGGGVEPPACPSLTANDDEMLLFVNAFCDCAIRAPCDKIEEALFEADSSQEENNPAVFACKASSAMKTWPTFSTKKQKEAIAADLLCFPWDKVSCDRRRDVLDSLRGAPLRREPMYFGDTSRGRDVVLVGATGIGKSSEMNFYLREFVRNIGEEGWFRTVLCCTERPARRTAARPTDRR